MELCADSKKEVRCTPVRPHSEQYEQLHSVVEGCHLVERGVLCSSRPVASHALAPILDVPRDVGDEYRRPVAHAQSIETARHRAAPARRLTELPLIIITS